MKTVVATFQNYTQAERAARDIKEQGLKTDDISIVAKEGDVSDYTGGTTSTMQTGGTTATMSADKSEGRNDNISDGVMTGGILGGLAGLLIGAGSLVMPGIGAIAAAGPITGFLSGAVTGGIVGGLVDLGIPEEQGREYQEQIRRGKVLFSMKTDDQNLHKVTSVLKGNAALSVDTY